MASDNTVETRGRLIYIEPNEFAAQKGAKFGDGVKGDNIVWNPEDMSMAVDLQVVVPRRDDCGDNAEFDVNIHTAGSTFMHNFVSFLGGTKIGDNGLKSSDRMLTDSYTDVSYNEIHSGGRSDRECIGISSIDIKFDSHFYPIVNMKFTDVRAQSLFMPAEQQYLGELDKKYNYKNFFQAVFHFPYPRFLLTIKGFYGNKVTFILAVNEFKSALNSQTGNMDIDISFIGYMYGLYTEIPMTMVLCAPYIDMEDGESVTIDNVDSVYGSYWADQRESVFRTMDDSAPLPTMLEYLVKYMNVSDDLSYEDLGTVSDMADNQQEKAMLEELRDCVKRVVSFFGEGSIDGLKRVATDNNSRHTLLQYDTDRMKAAYTNTGNYSIQLSDIKKEYDGYNLKTLLHTLYEKIKEYNTSDFKSHADLFFPFNYDEDKITFKCFYNVNDNGEAVQNSTLKVGDKTDIDKNVVSAQTVSEVIELFPDMAQSAFTEIYDCNYSTAEEGNSVKKSCNAFIVTSQLELYNKINVYISDLQSQESELTDDASEEIEEVFTEALGFKLSLENVYRMIFAHIDCFMHAFNESCLREIKDKKNSGGRTFNDLGLKHDSRQTDVKAKSNSCFVPPFFALYNDDRQIEYPGTANIGNISAMQGLDEVTFVDKLDKAAKMCGKIYATVGELMEQIEAENAEEGTDVTASINWNYSCFTDFMFGSRNPYTVLDFTNSETKIIDVLYIFYLRYLNNIKTNPTGKQFNKDDKTFYESELKNIENALPETISNSMYQSLMEFKDKKGDDLINLFNEKAKVNQDRFCKVDLSKECGKGVGMGSIPLYFSLNPLKKMENSDDYETFANKCSSLIVNNYDSYATQLKENFSIDDNTREKLYSGLTIGSKAIYANATIAAKPTSDKLDRYNTECSISALSGVSEDYKDTRNGSHNYWYMYRKTDDTDTNKNNFNQFVYDGKVKELFSTSNAVNKTLKLKADGTEVWGNFNGYDVTNYQLTLACYFLCSMFPLNSNDGDMFETLGKGNCRNLITIPKCFALMLGSLIFRARKMKEFKNKDVIYYRNTNTYYSCINGENMGVVHCDDKFISVNKENSMIYCLKRFIGTNKYLTNDNWYVSNNKYTILESYFCDWVVDEFLPIYDSFLKNPKLANGKDVDYECGFRMITFPKGTLKDYNTNTSKMCINSESKLNDFMCDLALDTVDLFVPYYTSNKQIDYTKDFLDYDFSDRIFNLYDRENKAITDMGNLIARLCSDKATNYEDKAFEVLREADETNKEIKKALYYSLKNLYDKWICSYGSIEKFRLQTPSVDRSCQKKRFKDGTYDSNACREYNNFLYVDSFYNYIGDEFMVNPMELYELIMRYSNGDKNNSVYEFMAEVAEKNKLLMIALPVYTNFYNSEEVVDIFTPHNIYNANTHQADGFNNTYVIMYTHEASKHLDDISDEEIGYEGDGYDLADSLGKIGQTATQLYNEKTGDPYNLNVNAFGVTYGMQNQSYFTDISVNMDNPIVTDYSIANQLQLSQTAAHGDVYYPFGIGQNIYSIYSNRSYACTVTMLGCANIMPLMYFQLNNVPMFKGAYMIVSVSHHISAGKMLTTFTGIRQSKYLVPFNKKIFNITSVVERIAKNERSGAGRSGSRSKSGGRAARDESGNLILNASSSLQNKLMETNTKFGGKCFPESGIPTTKDEMNKYITTVKVKVHASQTETVEKSIDVNIGFADTVKKVFNEIYNTKIKLADGVEKFIEIHTLAGWSWRSTKTTSGKNTNSPSAHAYGFALDINACSQGNPWFASKEAPSSDNVDTETKWRTWNHPLVKIMEKYGIGWGRFRSSFDSMHFGAVIARVDDNGHKITQ